MKFVSKFLHTLQKDTVCYIFDVYEVSIERINFPSNRDIDDHIKGISKVHVGEIQTLFVPRKNDIIIIKNEKYVVDYVIFSDLAGVDIILQVHKYNPSRIHMSGSDSWWEEIPLCTDLCIKEEKS